MISKSSVVNLKQIQIRCLSLSTNFYATVILIGLMLPISCSADFFTNSQQVTDICQADLTHVTTGVRINTILKKLPAQPGQKTSEQPHSLALFIAPIIDNVKQEQLGLNFQTNNTGLCLLSLKPGQYWLGTKQTKNNIGGSVMSESKTIEIVANQVINITLLTVLAIP